MNHISCPNGHTNLANGSERDVAISPFTQIQYTTLYCYTCQLRIVVNLDGDTIVHVERNAVSSLNG